MQIEPQVIVPLVYQITDPLDSTVYFIRAIIRDSSTGTILDTKNLAHQGSGRYTSSFLSPQDGQGTGRHIDVNTLVYTDSGYTSLSPIYQKLVDKYIVKKSGVSFGGGGGSGSGADIDYEKIYKLILKAVAELLDAKLEKTNLEPVHAKLNALGAMIEDNKPQENEPAEPVDLSPVLAAVKTLGSEVIQSIIKNKVEVKPQEKPDLSPVLLAISSLKEALTSSENLSEKNKAEIISKFEEVFSGMFGKIDEKNQKIKDALAIALGGVPLTPAIEKPQAPKTDLLSPYLQQK